MQINRIKGRLVLNLTSKAAAAYPSATLALWLLATFEQYRLSGMSASLSREDALFLQENERAAQAYIGSLNPPGKLLVEAVLFASKQPVYADFDQNLDLINVACTHAKAISDQAVPKLKISFTTRMQKDTKKSRFMTVKGDPVAAMGLEAASMALTIIRRAAERDEGVTLYLLNSKEIFGEALQGSRPAPEYAELPIRLIHQLLMDYLTKQIDLPTAKSLVGAIKVLSDHFVQHQVPSHESA
ncbi:hypothetical protein PLA107_032065 (plasmid) [Pseudomonas amygdali pv. lachrymans str. M301315]|uniref:Uncharacterized protein n=1 Tax=Pseudomonas amygdali pv. lachrymans str. M301315 TaxID=629260 RepID=A0AAD0PW67_PSEAV|nr:hypothetical protein PLA107_032065 [Pseudomonas amygdali pv. lachrymans str. M301315]